MLEMKHVSKTFNPGTVNEKKALCDLNLVLEDGDFATIVGSNGAGKSTTFNAITGAFYVDEGQIILDGEDLSLIWVWMTVLRSRFDCYPAVSGRLLPFLWLLW